MNESHSLIELKVALQKAIKAENDMEIERIEWLIEKKKISLPEPLSPIHTNHHKKEDTTSINQEGCLDK